MQGSFTLSIPQEKHLLKLLLNAHRRLLKWLIGSRFWITFKEEQRLEWQKKYLSQLCETDQEIRAANELIQEFTTMLRERKGEGLDAWLEKAEQQGIPELRGFALSLKRDYQAVKAGLTLAWSQGPVEGHVHRLKLLKRQAYGRAGFQTLRKRVLQCS